MRVAHVMAPARYGGAEQVVLDLTAALAEGGAQVHLIAIFDEGVSQHPFLEREQRGLRVHPIVLPPRRYRRERREVLQRVRSVDAQVVHTHGYRSDVVAGVGAWRAGFSTVSTVHGFTGGGLRNRTYEWLQRRALRRFDAVVAVSRPMAHGLREDGVDSSRLHVIPNARSPVSELLGSDEARSRLGVPPDAFHVGWIGRMSREKGPDVMLAALHELERRSTVPDFRASFVGAGREGDALREQASQGALAGRVRWTGEIPGAARLLSAFDVVALSSRTEGTPVVAIEALSAGIPLVATRVGGVSDLTGSESALLVPPEDPVALAAALEDVYRNPDAARARVRAGRSRMKEVASVKAWAERYMEVYREVAGEAAPEPKLVP